MSPTGIARNRLDSALDATRRPSHGHFPHSLPTNVNRTQRTKIHYYAWGTRRCTHGRHICDRLAVDPARRAGGCAVCTALVCSWLALLSSTRSCGGGAFDSLSRGRRSLCLGRSSVGARTRIHVWLVRLAESVVLFRELPVVC